MVNISIFRASLKECSYRVSAASFIGLMYTRYNLLLTNLPKLSFLNFLDETNSVSKNCNVGKRVTGSVTRLPNVDS